MPRVSVLMPVYNVKEEYLRESIESILNQTFTDFEFIILDDCSSNNVEEIVKSYGDDRIRFYRNSENLGIAKSRNKLMDLARGEYSALMDNDDISHPERLKKQVDFLDNNPDISILSTAYETFPEKHIIVHPKSVRYLDLYKGCVVAHPAVMFRTERLREYKLKYKESYICSQDYELWARAIRYLKIANLDSVLLKYRVSSDSITHCKTEKAQEEDNIIKQNMLDFLTENSELQAGIASLLFDISAKREYRLPEKIFSVKNVDNRKVVTILGFKVKIKRRKSEKSF